MAIEKTEIVGNTIKIRSPNEAGVIAQEISSNPSMLSLITAIAINDDGEDLSEGLAALEVDDDAKLTKSAVSTDGNGEKLDEDGREIDPVMLRVCGPVVQILDAVYETGRLESFSWSTTSDVQDLTKAVRPKAFWNALWRHAKTLRTLELVFYIHEVSYVAPPSVQFPALRTIMVDASSGHGCKGDVLDHLLKRTQDLEELHMRLPNCDHDTCRIQGMSWDYDLPHLKTFSLHAFDSAPAALTEFLNRNSRVEVLSSHLWDDHTRDHKKEGACKSAVQLAPTSLPNLRALSLTDVGNTCRSPDQYFNPKANRPIQHLRIAGWVGNQKLYEPITAAAMTLRCLELEFHVSSMRSNAASISALPEIKELLLSLSELRELGVCFESAHYHPDQAPMGVDDLKSVLNLLPSQTKIRALRFYDSAGDTLPEELLNDFPDVPPSLEFLGWECKEGRLLYRFERSDGKVRAVRYEPVRENSRNASDWTDDRILEYEG
ncbi:hypothetical protein GQ43DRAFT_474886 [Delitschia confertaspora ATCC 74209]|uniref:Uncharacterized protein n=1 Tax=Delitschia confertaspora ATCC 74209 TaxID=1513339 RepID=A0A9P4JF98_9PLEO|nr:hypothetical protein GQ43DRAFT_474886 [Delitschia confertaspora ATCC 74209]